MAQHIVTTSACSEPSAGCSAQRSWWREGEKGCYRGIGKYRDRQGRVGRRGMWGGGRGRVFEEDVGRRE